MKGLELCRNYYCEYGEKMIKENFAEVADRITVGLAGEGSECFGYDDKYSEDHDFEPSFCMWITQEEYDRFGFKLERAYAKLPKEYGGFVRQNVNPCGGNRRGVVITEDFYGKILGMPREPRLWQEWLNIPMPMLACATDGEVFTPNDGLFCKIREVLKQGYPEDVRLKKTAAALALAGQAGQYNYNRCLMHGEEGAAQLAVYEFAEKVSAVVFLLNKAYMPYYKWRFRAMRSLPKLSSLADPLEYLIQTDNCMEVRNSKMELIEDVCSQIIEELKAQGITRADCNHLDTHAYSVTDFIKDVNIRSLHVMEGI